MENDCWPALPSPLPPRETAHSHVEHLVFEEQPPLRLRPTTRRTRPTAAATTAATADTPSALRDLLAGGVAGSAGVLVGHPFDTVKVRMQTSAVASSGRSAAEASWQELAGPLGLRSLFRGAAAPVAAASAVNALLFCSYGASCRWWDGGAHRFFDAPGAFNSEGGGALTAATTWRKPFFCGVFTGAVTSLVVAPIEHVKCRLQADAGQIYRGPTHAARDIVRAAGIRGLYRGFLATCLRQGPSLGVYFASYDRFKALAQEALGSLSASDRSAPPTSTSWMVSVLAGGLSGSLAWAICYPVDVIKSRIQILPLDSSRTEHTIRSVTRTLVRNEGWAGLYRGLGITVLRAFPVNGIIFPAYEMSSRWIDALARDVQSTSIHC